MKHIVSQSGGTLLDKIVDSIISPNVVLFLNQTLYRNPFIILNYWSFVHILSGISFYFLKPKKYKIKDWFMIWLYGNILFEIIEYVLALGGNPLFVEEFIDIIWDILWGLLGFGIIYYLKTKTFKKELFKNICIASRKGSCEGI